MVVTHAHTVWTSAYTDVTWRYALGNIDASQAVGVKEHYMPAQSIRLFAQTNLVNKEEKNMIYMSTFSQILYRGMFLTL